MEWSVAEAECGARGVVCVAEPCSARRAGEGREAIDGWIGGEGPAGGRERDGTGRGEVLGL
jgi:hypothetical protein